MAKPERTTIAIIGGGVVGTAIARELAKFELNILLVEKHPDIAMGATKANSGILHAGFDAPPGSLKARLNVRGNRLYREMAADLQIDVQMVGSLVVAKGGAEMQVLDELVTRGRTNGVTGLTMLSREETLAIEPNLAPDVSGALSAETGGIVLPFAAALAFGENAIRNGVQIILECPVEKVVVAGGRVTGLQTARGFMPADYVINAAGVYADEISRSAGDDSFSITARKGEYILFDKAVGSLVRSVIFPTPSKVSKGIIVSPTVHGNLFIGPNANEVDDKEDLATSALGTAAIITAARRLVPGLPLAAAITQFAGLRAAADGDDFVIKASDRIGGLIHAAGIQSPGLTAAPAIAELVAEILADQGVTLVPKKEFVAINRRRPVFHELDDTARAALIAGNSHYGRVICRCETVTEGEIAAAIHGCCGAATLDGVKRRTRAGMGRCQGGFCGPRVTAILARELGIGVDRVRKDSASSYLFTAKTAAAEEESQ